MRRSGTKSDGTGLSDGVLKASEVRVMYDRLARLYDLAASPFAVAFFLAELGDKTMLATVTLATDNGVIGTWIGSTIGMVAADGLAIIVGQQLGARLPERTVKIGAAITFAAFGIYLIVDGLV